MRKKYIGTFSIGEINYCLNKESATQIKLHMIFNRHELIGSRLRKYSDMLELNPLLSLELGLEEPGKIHYLKVKEINWKDDEVNNLHLCELVITCRTTLEKRQLLEYFRTHKKIGYR
ncbi:hypothetical protein JZO82_04100 [Vagococcus fluvialis]|uniref:hypothetical protein n=1 Tax=Vagococcus fluvialis TaxID=2738 RepID=UPI001A8FA70E|nr:hypothetical protein [Vagococcus fluvialis]MBO0428338.1 hypothetical protein [Vagococcus fluvialis]